MKSEWEYDHNLIKAYDDGYERGGADKEKQIKEMLTNLPTRNGYIDSTYLWLKWEQLKEQSR